MQVFQQHSKDEWTRRRRRHILILQVLYAKTRSRYSWRWNHGGDSCNKVPGVTEVTNAHIHQEEFYRSSIFWEWKSDILNSRINSSGFHIENYNLENLHTTTCMWMIFNWHLIDKVTSYLRSVILQLRDSWAAIIMTNNL